MAGPASRRIEALSILPRKFLSGWERLDLSEELAKKYLQSIGTKSVIYQPDGNIPPEVRRLNQNEITDSGYRGLEETSSDENGPTPIGKIRRINLIIQNNHAPAILQGLPACSLRIFRHCCCRIFHFLVPHALLAPKVRARACGYGASGRHLVRFHHFG